MTITLFQTHRFGWHIEIDNGLEWILLLRISDEATARAYVTQEYPDSDPIVEPPNQPTLFGIAETTPKALFREVVAPPKRSKNLVEKLVEDSLRGV
jgi:hypothetical protein